MRLNSYLPVDENGERIGLAYKDQTQKFAYNASNALEYLGRAVPGSLSASAVWQIKKFLYDSNYNMSAALWASGSIDFEHVWDDRVGLSYL